MKKYIQLLALAISLLITPAFADVAYTPAAGSGSVGILFSNGLVSSTGAMPTSNGLCYQTSNGGATAYFGACSGGGSMLWPATTGLMVYAGGSAYGTSLAIPIINSNLANSSITIAGHAVSLGGTQAIACADLSNGGTGCSSTTGTSGATLPLNNGNNTFSGSNTFSGATNFSSTFQIGGNTMTFPGAPSTLLYSGGALGTPTSGTATNLSGTATNLVSGKLVSVSLGDTVYGDGTGATSILPGNTSTSTKVLTQIGSGSASSPPVWQPIPAFSTSTYYLTNSASDVSGYLAQTASPDSGSYTVTASGLTAGNTLLKDWVTPVGQPGLSYLPAGQYEVNIHAAKTVGSLTAVIYGEIWEVSAAGVDIAKIGTLTGAPVLSGTNVNYVIDFTIGTVYNFASGASRVDTRIYTNVSGSGSAPTVVLYYGGSNNSRMSIPYTSVNANNYVPYSGAVQDLLMGAYNVSATTFTGSGSGLTGTASSLSIGGTAALATNATTATNVAGGSANQFVYQIGAGATSSAANVLAVCAATGECYAANTGTSDALVISIPSLTSLAAGTNITVGATAANTTTTPTLALNGGTAYTIVRGNNQALNAGDIPGASAKLTLQWSATNSNWTLKNPATLLATAVTPNSYTNANITVGADGRLTAASNGSAPAAVSPQAPTPGMRLTLTSAVPVTTADVFNATTVFYTSGTIYLYSGSAWTVFQQAQLSIAVPATTNTAYDVYDCYNAGSPALSLTAWTTTTTQPSRGNQDGFVTKSGDATCLLVGGFMTGTVSGQTEDSGNYTNTASNIATYVPHRYLSNFYNRVSKMMVRAEPATSWTYGTANTTRQVNNSSLNQLSFFTVDGTDSVSAVYNDAAASASAGAFVRIGLGLNSVTAFVGPWVQLSEPAANAAIAASMSTSMQVSPGYNYISALETPTAVVTWTFYGGSSGNMNLSGTSKF